MPSNGAELGNTGCVHAGKNTRFTGVPRYGPRFVNHTARTVRRVVAIIPRRLFRDRSDRGKLRALYDDAAQPCPTRMIELLRALDAEKIDSALTQIPHLGTIN